MTVDLDLVCRLEDAGAGAIVMHSLYEEQVVVDQPSLMRAYAGSPSASARALSYFPRPWEYATDPDEYLTQIQRIKERVRVPVIGSLNGETASGWLKYATNIEEAGADALELNVFHVSTDPDDDCSRQTQELIEVVRTIRQALKIPIAVKVSPYHCSLPALARQLHEAGAVGLTLFNSSFHLDLDLEKQDVVKRVELTDPRELSLRLRWLSILDGTSQMSLAASGGIHDGLGALKAVMCGANAVQMVSALLRHGPEFLTDILLSMEAWLEEHEISSLQSIRGTLSLLRCPDPKAVERGRYVQMLQTWKGPGVIRPERLQD